MKKILWFVFASLCILIGLYPLSYLFVEYGTGFFQQKEAAQLQSIIWKTAFYLHISFAGLALLIGWTLFVKRIRAKWLHIHRFIGKVYVLSVMIGGMSGFYISYHGNGGPIARSGFMIGAIVWLYVTYQAYNHIRNKNISMHETMMRYSYAGCFGGVTLRFLLPALVIYYQNIEPSYQIVAWMSWVPNMVVAFWIDKYRRKEVQLATI
jgi:uncharacterized membrane protein